MRRGRREYGDRRGMREIEIREIRMNRESEEGERTSYTRTRACYHSIVSRTERWRKERRRRGGVNGIEKSLVSKGTVK